MSLVTRPGVLAIIALIFLSLPALANLAKPGFYTSHDGETHTARMAQYYQALVDGQIPPRFAGTFYNGLGSPIFVYIYPLPYFLGSTLHLIGLSFTSAFKLLMAFSFITSGIFFYLWLAEILKSEKAAAAGALFYMWVPYRFLLIYVRGSLSEALAYTFLPLVLLTITKLSRNPNFLKTAITGISTALLLLSQNLVALISLPIITIYLILVSLINKSPKSPVFGFAALTWGFLISSFVYLPAIFERKFTRFDEIITIAYPDHFVTVKQLIRSPWGYGFDLPGTINDQISLQIGLAHILVFLTSAALILYLILRQKIKGQAIVAIYFISVFAISTFLMLQTKITSYVWQRVSPLHIIDIPWRLLGITSLALSYLAAFSTKYIKPGLFFLFLASAVLVANRNHLRINQAVERDDSFFAAYQGSATQYDEFTPKWRQSTRVPIGFDPAIPVEVVSGNANIENVKARSNKITFTALVTSEQASVRINKFYFPGWDVLVDGQKLTPFDDLTITDTNTLLLDVEQDASGLMMVNLERGNHQVNAKLGETKLRLFANFLSFGSLVLALAVLAKTLTRHPDPEFAEGEGS